MVNGPEEAAIRALEVRFAAAFNIGDIDAMMKNYIPDKSLVVFDVVPPRQHLGADAYRKAGAGFFAHFKGNPKIAITDLVITVDGTLGFSHSIQHVTGTDTRGHSVDRTVRVTDGYRKIGGNWLIVLGVMLTLLWLAPVMVAHSPLRNWIIGRALAKVKGTASVGSIHCTTWPSE